VLGIDLPLSIFGRAPDRTTGKRQARAFTSFIEAANLSEKLGSQAS
jgi:hypothetical protein